MTLAWDELFQRLSLAYGWRADEIAKLTPAQAYAYLPENAREEPRIAWLTPAEARALIKQR